jgi:hypothetical protein
LKQQYRLNQSERRHLSQDPSQAALTAVGKIKGERRVQAACVARRWLAVAFSIGLLGLVLLSDLGRGTVARALASEPRILGAISEPGGAARAPLALSISGTITNYLPLIGKNYVSERPLWRFGAAKALHSITDYDSTEMKRLRLGWYVDWHVTSEAPRPYGIEYVPVISVKQWKLQGSDWTDWCVGCPYVVPYTYTIQPDPGVIASMASAHPGMTWVIGNEMERIDWATGGQNEMLPEVYAEAYYTLYSLLKSADPSAQVAIGGMVEATPLRLQYLDRVWNEYLTRYSTSTMPVDVWNVHAFVLQEKSCVAHPGDCWGADIPAGLTTTEGVAYTVQDNKNFSLVWSQILALRSWMKAHEQQNKPLILTEYGVNFPDWVNPGQFTPEQLRDSFMYPSFTAFLNTTDTALGYPADGYRLVQRWNWYSLDDDSGYYDGGTFLQSYNGNLFYSGLGAFPQGLAPLGLYWQQYVQNLSEGSSPPYASSQTVLAGAATRAAPSGLPSCPSSVKLRFYELGHSPTWVEGAAETLAPPKLVREVPLCR